MTQETQPKTAGPDLPEVRREEVSIRGESYGLLRVGQKGPRLHFSHATGFCAGLYAPLLRQLARHFRITAYDARGHGETSAAADPESFRSWRPYIADLTAYLDSCDEPLILMGHSLGGVLSSLAAARRPDVVAALVLLDPTLVAPHVAPFWALAKLVGTADRVPIAARARERSAVWPDRETMIEAYASKGTFSTWRREFLEAYVCCATKDRADGQVELRCDPAWEARTFATAAAWPWSALRSLRCPVLAMGGAPNEAFPAASRTALRLLVRRLRLLEFPDSTHFFPMEIPERVISEILAFTRDLPEL